MDGSMPAGTILGERWRITGVLGSGGFGRVYEVEDTSEVGLGGAALKVLHPNTSPQERASFLNEVKKIALLRHQNLVGYLDSGLLRLDGGDPAVSGEVRPFLVAELCDGSLDDTLKASPGGILSTDEVLGVLDDVVAGLGHLHDRGLIHRDIKPANVLYADGFWKLADFGLMRDLSASGAYHRGELLMGTPLYMAPELFSTMQATAASDVYAVGVLVHVCATGRALHAGAGQALAFNIASQPPTIDPGLDPRLHDLVARATDPTPEYRPAAHELVALIDGAAHLQVDSGPTVAAPLAPPTVATPSWPAPAPTPTGDPQAWSGPTPTGDPQGWSGPAPAPVPRPTPHHGSVHPGHAPPPTPFGSAAPEVGGGDGGPSWPQPAPFAGPKPRSGGGAILAAVLAVAAVVLIGAAGLGVFLLRGGDDDVTAEPVVAGGTPDSVISTPTVDVPDIAVPTTGSAVTPGVAAPDPVVSAPGVDQPLSHFVAPPCEPSPLGKVEVVNRHGVHLDYWLTVNHRNADGALIEETFDTVTALPPGGRAVLDNTGFEEGAVSCEISSFQLTPTDPAAIANLGAAELMSCTLDDFFSQQYNYTVRVTNPRAETVDADVWVSIVGPDGLRLDDSFSTDVDGIPPGDTAQVDDDNTYWDLELSPEATPVQCQIVAVSLDRAS